MTAYLRPVSLADALAARLDHPDYAILAGGTDWMIGATRRPPPPGVIDVFGLAPLVGVTRTDRGLRIGAATTFAALLRSDVVHQDLPALWEAARELGAVQIQERATLGGNVATSSPAGDSLPVLLALDAMIELDSTRGTRLLPYAQFCTGYRQTALEADELIVAIRFAREEARLEQFWRKVGTRRAQSIAKVSLAGAARLGADGVVDHVRIALGAVRDRPMRARSAEAALEGRTPGPAAASAVAAAVRLDIAPIDDARSTADYRRTVAGNLGARFVQWLGERVRATP